MIYLLIIIFYPKILNNCFLSSLVGTQEIILNKDGFTNFGSVSGNISLVGTHGDNLLLDSSK